MVQVMVVNGDLNDFQRITLDAMEDRGFTRPFPHVAPLRLRHTRDRAHLLVTEVRGLNRQSAAVDRHHKKRCVVHVPLAECLGKRVDSVVLRMAQCADHCTHSPPS